VESSIGQSQQNMIKTQASWITGPTKREFGRKHKMEPWCWGI